MVPCSGWLLDVIEMIKNASPEVVAVGMGIVVLGAKIGTKILVANLDIQLVELTTWFYVDVCVLAWLRICALSVDYMGLEAAMLAAACVFVLVLCSVWLFKLSTKTRGIAGRLRRYLSRGGLLFLGAAIAVTLVVTGVKLAERIGSGTSLS